MNERINENGIREVFCEADGKWYPDTLHENGITYFLDERPDRFHYYPIIADETREEVMAYIIASEEADRNAPELPWEKIISEAIAAAEKRAANHA